MLFNSTIAVIFDDHRLFSHSFSGFLERLKVFSQVLTVEQESDVMPTLLKSIAHGSVYFFLDYQIGDHNSIHLQHDVKRISKKIKTIIITSAMQPAILYTIIAQSPAALISKSSGTDVIMECLYAIENGRQYICPEITEITNNSASSNSGKHPFTVRELEVLQYFSKGLSIAETAEQVHLSRFTIVNHRSNMMRKSKTKSIVDLLAYARRLELI